MFNFFFFLWSWSKPLWLILSMPALSSSSHSAPSTFTSAGSLLYPSSILARFIFIWNMPLAFSTLPSWAELLVHLLLILALALLAVEDLGQTVAAPARKSGQDYDVCERRPVPFLCHLEAGVTVVGLDESCNNPILHCWKSDMPGMISECLVKLAVLKSAWLPLELNVHSSPLLFDHDNRVRKECSFLLSALWQWWPFPPYRRSQVHVATLTNTYKNFDRYKQKLG